MSIHNTGTSVILLFGIILGATIIAFLIIRMIKKGNRDTSILFKSINRILVKKDIKISTIVQYISVGVEIYSNKGQLIYTNKHNSEIFGNSDNELPSNITIANNPNFTNSMKEAFFKGEPIEIDTKYDFEIVATTNYYNSKYKTGTKYINWKGAPIMDVKGNMKNYVFIVTDITKQKEQEEQIKETILLSNQGMKASKLKLWRYNNQTQIIRLYNNTIDHYEQEYKFTPELCSAISHPDSLKILIDNLDAIRRGEDKPFEIDIIIRDSENSDWEYCTLSGTPYIKDIDGKVIEYTGFIRNNSSFVRLNQELAKLNTQNKLILDNTNSGLAFITSDYIVQWENVSTCSKSISIEIFKKGHLCYETSYNRTSPCDDCPLARALVSGHFEQQKSEINGRVMEITALPIINDADKIEGVVIRMDDITERQQMIQELEDAKESAIQSDKLKSTFLANMSHEIRTPLNAIVGFADLLVTTDDYEDKLEYSKIISTNNDLLLRLINDILNLSKIEAGIADRKVELVDLAIHFKELTSTMQQRITNPNIEFIIDNPYKQCIVSIDRDRLSQVIYNYFTNSIKYTVKGFIKIGYGYKDDGIYTYVSDSGIGISEDKKHRVYNRFEKLDDFAQGTGLGLSICKALTEKAGGKVGFETEVGVGSTFWSWVPTAADIITNQEENGTSSSEEPNDTATADANTTAITVDKKRILIAEDIESNFKLISAILNNRYDLTWVKNGEDVVKKASTEKFDIILMDMKMPKMNGLDATKSIRVFDKNTPILALTAHAFDADKNAAMVAGCDSYIVKPVNKMILLNALNKYC